MALDLPIEQHCEGGMIAQHRLDALRIHGPVSIGRFGEVGMRAALALLAALLLSLLGCSPGGDAGASDVATPGHTDASHADATMLRVEEARDASSHRSDRVRDAPVDGGDRVRNTAMDAGDGDDSDGGGAPEQGPESSDSSTALEGREDCRTDADCDDAIACTADRCASNSTCVHDVASCQCIVNSDCSDGMAETFDECVAQRCSARHVYYTPDVQPILQAKCATCHTTDCSGGTCFATSFSDAIKAASGACSPLTVAQCIPIVLATGAMPAGRGCTGDPISDTGSPGCLTANERAIVDAWVAASNPQADRSPPAFCAQGANDRVTRIFCGSERPSIRQMSDLLDRLDGSQKRAFALAHSTALSGGLVSAINPRIVRTYSSSGNSGFYAALAFVRGEQRVELAAREGGKLRFYLLEFQQACNSKPGGCTPGDRFTSAIETDWLSFTIRSDEELKNTPMDCRRCHGASPEEAMLLMRELAAPWNHWFNNSFFQELDVDFLLSRGQHVDLIAGVRVGVLGGSIFPADEQSLSGPGSMESLVRNQGRPQQPTFGYDLFLTGDAPASPYRFSRAADPTKLRQMSAQYLAFLDGELPRDQVPDLADVFLDVPQERAEIGLAVELGATGPELLLQACGQCHNDRLDQTISRARFNAKALTPGYIEMAPLPDAEIRAAIERLSLPAGSPGRMPPAGARVLDDAGRDRLIEYLRQALTHDTMPAPTPGDTVPEVLAAHRVWIDTAGRAGVRANLGGMNLDGADLQDANLESAKLSGASLRGANLSRAKLMYVDLAGANLTSANLEGANLEGADLTNVAFEGARFTGASLANTRLIIAKLGGANLRNVNLTGARLAAADLSRADLVGANLSYVDLTNADLGGADLQGADLEGAVLRSTDIQDSRIDGANLSRANLLGARVLTQPWLDTACGNPQTILQDALTIAPCP
jgi:uncharacterized protein YjbI with pentapeptide repeats/mono/diheme cytochrome c family protein